jgi:hypothetical protein
MFVGGRGVESWMKWHGVIETIYGKGFGSRRVRSERKDRIG